jgi:hypothetical protein
MGATDLQHIWDPPEDRRLLERSMRIKARGRMDAKRPAFRHTRITSMHKVKVPNRQAGAPVKDVRRDYQMSLEARGRCPCRS